MKPTEPKLPSPLFLPPQEFPPVPTDDVVEENSNWEKLLDKVDVDGKQEIASTLHNVRILLKFHPDFRGTIAWNTYSKRLEIRGQNAALKEYVNADAEAIVTGAQDYLAHVHKINVNYADLTRRIVYEARKSNPFNPLVDHLKSLVWDEIQRIDNFFLRYFGAGKCAGEIPTPEEKERIAHLQRIGRRWLLGAVERAFRPGCKVDNILILEGLQGARKTSALEALGGEFYCSTQITLGDKDSKMIAACNWFVDMPDTHFMKRDNRGFVTMREDTFRPPFGASVEKTKRCCIFIGSVNPTNGSYQYFDEEERRYW